MSFFIQRTLNKLTQAVIDGDLSGLKKQISKLDPQQRAQQDFQFQGQAVSLVELAVSAGQAKALQQLLNAGCPFENTDPPLLYQAMQHPREGLALCTVLLQAGSATEYPGLSPASAALACFELCPDNRLMLFLSRLNEYGANLNSADRDGVTPLMKALQKEQQPLVQMLVNSGAQLPENLPDNWCSAEILQCAKRCAEDLRIRQIMLGR